MWVLCPHLIILLIYSALLVNISSNCTLITFHRAHIQAFIDKFRFNAKRASLVQSRIKALERLWVSCTHGGPESTVKFRSWTHDDDSRKPKVGSGPPYFENVALNHHCCQMARANFLDCMCLTLRAWWTMASFRYAAKFDPFLHPCAIQRKDGIKLCHLATL